MSELKLLIMGALSFISLAVMLLGFYEGVWNLDYAKGSFLLIVSFSTTKQIVDFLEASWKLRKNKEE